MSSGGDDEVGYGKPPKHSRFKKGQSGNPAGRKAGDRSKSTSFAVAPLHPTRRALTQRADRPVAIIEDGKRHQVATRDAIFGALTVTALKGGVLAQRTMIQLMQAEDERRYGERSETFNFWRDHVINARAKMNVAIARGRPLPDILPHPDDVLLDYETLTVRIIGPADEQEAKHFAMIRRAASLCFELSLYHREDNHFDQVDAARSRIGFWLIHHVELVCKLPPRMRESTVEEGAKLHRRMHSRAKAWEAYLRSESEALGLPFFRYRKPWKAVDIGPLLPDKLVETIWGSP